MAHPDAIARAAGLIAKAERPLLITSAFGRNPGEVAALQDFVETQSVGAVGFRARYLFLGNDHPCHIGYEPGPVIGESDCIIVFDCEVPWIPQLHKPHTDAPVIHIESDPRIWRFPHAHLPVGLRRHRRSCSSHRGARAGA